MLIHSGRKGCTDAPLFACGQSVVGEGSLEKPQRSDYIIVVPRIHNENNEGLRWIWRGYVVYYSIVYYSILYRSIKCSAGWYLYGEGRCRKGVLKM